MKALLFTLAAVVIVPTALTADWHYTSTPDGKPSISLRVEDNAPFYSLPDHPSVLVVSPGTRVTVRASANVPTGYLTKVRIDASSQTAVESGSYTLPNAGTAEARSAEYEQTFTVTSITSFSTMAYTGTPTNLNQSSLLGASVSLSVPSSALSIDCPTEAIVGEPLTIRVRSTAPASTNTQLSTVIKNAAGFKVHNLIEVTKERDWTAAYTPTTAGQLTLVAVQYSPTYAERYHIITVREKQAQQLVIHNPRLIDRDLWSQAGHFRAYRTVENGRIVGVRVTQYRGNTGDPAVVNCDKTLSVDFDETTVEPTGRPWNE